MPPPPLFAALTAATSAVELHGTVTPCAANAGVVDTMTDKKSNAPLTTDTLANLRAVIEPPMEPQLARRGCRA
ncbi:MAG TPA: hypothetical protein VGJ03_02870 [Acidimicrobiales bacterium]